MDSPATHVKYDQRGVSYVEYEDLRASPVVRRQLEAARRVMANLAASEKAAMSEPDRARRETR